jgi:hypothetical protein
VTTLEVADIFRDQGPAWRRTHAGHISLGQLKVMSAIERCRSAALGGHVLCCKDCSQIQIADNEHTTACVYLCKSCGSPMLIIETFYAAHAPRAPPIGQP